MCTLKKKKEKYNEIMLYVALQYTWEAFIDTTEM